MTTKKKFTGRVRTSKPERYHHLRNVEIEYDNGRTVTNVTAFIRQDDSGQWCASFAECDSRDHFDRRRGRCVARRKWFQGNRVLVKSPEFDTVFRAGEYNVESVEDCEACAS